MGFFSYECKICHKSALSIYAINDVNGWMVDVVAIYPDGSLVFGKYDGYGRIESKDGAVFECPGDLVETGVWDMFHKACWDNAGGPTKYETGSVHAQDQGFFFDNEDYDIPEPAGYHE
jgi:hypothetical protein